MKTFLIASLTGLCCLILLRTTRFDQFDLNSDQFVISWEDITDDLWP